MSEATSPSSSSAAPTQAQLLARVHDQVEASVAEVALMLTEHASFWLRDHERLHFDEMTTEDLSVVMERAPALTVLFALLASYPNQALKRELGFQLSGFAPILPGDRRRALARLLHPHLTRMSLEAVLAVYRSHRTDVAMRHADGQWEEVVRERAHALIGLPVSTESFPAPVSLVSRSRPVGFILDVVVRDRGGRFLLGVKCSRFDSGEYPHCRATLLETVESAKRAYPTIPLVLLLHHPHLANHERIRRDLLKVSNVDVVVFAIETPESVDDALALALRACAPHLHPAAGVVGRQALPRPGALTQQALFDH